MQPEKRSRTCEFPGSEVKTEVIRKRAASWDVIELHGVVSLTIVAFVLE
jgi:hypothetical protein